MRVVPRISKIIRPGIQVSIPGHFLYMIENDISCEIQKVPRKIRCLESETEKE